MQLSIALNQEDQMLAEYIRNRAGVDTLNAAVSESLRYLGLHREINLMKIKSMGIPAECMEYIPNPTEERCIKCVQIDETIYNDLKDRSIKTFGGSRPRTSFLCRLALRAYAHWLSPEGYNDNDVSGEEKLVILSVEEFDKRNIEEKLTEMYRLGYKIWEKLNDGM